MNVLEVKLENFEGPLDLLIYLIKKNRMSIYEISIVKIADQFLETVQRASFIYLEKAADFLNLATYLIYLKSKMLLPVDNYSNDDIDIEEGKFSLTQRLLEYSFYKDVATYFDKLENRSKKFLRRNKIISVDKSCEKIYDAYTLANFYFPLIDKKEINITFSKEKIDFREVVERIKDIVFKKGDIIFSEIIHSNMNRLEIVVSFMAMLELVKLRFISAVQRYPFGDIYIKNNKYG
ncbi:MAG: ScpA family protein [Deferribacterota bacterium]|nr:ScpA family protein [Deferribacterota bacterium]